MFPVYADTTFRACVHGSLMRVWILYNIASGNKNNSRLAVHWESAQELEPNGYKLTCIEMIPMIANTAYANMEQKHIDECTLKMVIKKFQIQKAWRKGAKNSNKQNQCSPTT